MTLPKNHPPVNISLPLFTWANHQDALIQGEIPLAARVIGRRYRLSPARAALIAELAGIGGAR